MNYVKSFVRLYDTALQYGITPYRLLLRSLSDCKPVLANSIPKAGTNLLLRLLYLLPGYYRPLRRTITDLEVAMETFGSTKSSQILVGHIKFRDDIDTYLKERGICNLLMVRDPRAVAWSNIKYITYMDRRHRLHDYFANVLKDDETRLIATLDGISGDLLDDGVPSLSLSEHFDGFLPWIARPSCLLIRYEDLVGGKGGGDDGRQRKTVREVLEFIQYSDSEKQLGRVVDKLYSNASRTFRRGNIDHWRQEMPGHLQRICNSRLSKAIETLGYEY